MRKRNRKVRILISGGYGNGNAGDEALMITMLEHLRKSFANNCEFKIFSDNVAYSRSRYNEDFIYSGGRGVFEENKKGLKRITWFFENIKAIFWCDLFITGGGTILQDTTHFMFVPFWLSKVFLALIFGKKTMMYGIGVGPMRTKFARFMSRLVINRVDLVTLRGASSYIELKDMKISRPEIHVLSDPAIALSVAPSRRIADILREEGIDAEKSYVSFAIRQWFITHSKSLKKAPFWTPDNRAKYEKMIHAFASAADYVISKHKKQIVFIPMSITGSKDDRLAATDVVNNMHYRGENVHIIKGDYRPEETKGLIGASELLISMRLHSAIFAVPLCIPCVSIAYGKKMIDFMKEMGLEKYVIGVDDLTEKRLKALIDEIISNPQRAVAEESVIRAAQEKNLKNGELAAKLTDRI